MNKVIQKGRFTADPELRQTANQKSVSNFTIAVNRRFKQEGQPDADFFRCVAWGGLGEFIHKNFKKGQEILIVGRLENRTWQDQNGTTRYTTEITVEEAYFTGSKKVKDGEQIPDNDDSTVFGDDDLPF